MKKLNVIIFLLCIYSTSYAMNNPNQNSPKPISELSFKDKLHMIMHTKIFNQSRQCPYPENDKFNSDKEKVKGLYNFVVLFSQLSLENDLLIQQGSSLINGLNLHLIFNKMHFKKEDQETLAETLSDTMERINLTSLYLDNNFLTSLPNEFGQLTNLKILSLKQNLLEDIPATIYEHKQLNTLAIEQNPIALNVDKMDELLKKKNSSLFICYKKN